LIEDYLKLQLVAVKRYRAILIAYENWSASESSNHAFVFIAPKNQGALEWRRGEDRKSAESRFVFFLVIRCSCGRAGLRQPEFGGRI
jgi:hypothetical protein